MLKKISDISRVRRQFFKMSKSTIGVATCSATPILYLTSENTPIPWNSDQLESGPLRLNVSTPITQLKAVVWFTRILFTSKSRTKGFKLKRARSFRTFIRIQQKRFTRCWDRWDDFFSMVDCLKGMGAAVEKSRIVCCEVQ